MAQVGREHSETKAPVSLPLAFVAVWFAALIAVSISIRVAGAGAFYYNADELMHISISRVSSIGQILNYSLFDAHPPLEYILRHYWMDFSNDPGFIRSFSLVFGILLIAIYYRIGSLLGGQFTGLTCAAFAAFSHGCIMQSYLVRNYTVFLCFLSLGFYYFIKWHRQRTMKDLIGYTVFCGLACLTHFAAIFALLAMTVCEAYSLYKDRLQSELKQWLCVNAGLALVEAGEVCLYWQNDLSPRIGGSFEAYYKPLVKAILYPLNVGVYEFPNHVALAIAGLLVVGSWRLAGRELRALYVLNLAAFAIGMLLLITGLYPFGPSRHSLWTFPFIACAGGWALSCACSWLADQWRSALVPYAMAVLILVCGWACYNPQVRFSNPEYILTGHEWQGLSHYLRGLDSHSLIIAERADAFLIDPPGVNLYSLMGPEREAVLAPYAGTHLLFLTAYNKFDGQTLIRMLQRAYDNGWLEGVDSLVFVRSSITTSAILSLELCHELDKQIIPFADEDHPGFRPVSEVERIRSYPAAALVLSTPAFFNQVAEPLGIAHHCTGRGWHM